MLQNILPTPKKIQSFPGRLEVKPAIWTDWESFAPHLEVFADAAWKMLNTRTQVAPGGIRVEYDPSLSADAYTIDSRKEVVLRASDAEGLLYGLATLLFLLEPLWIGYNCGTGFTCECARIEDQPEKPYRGLMVDLARQWHPARQIFCYIDLCFAMKLRYLHLHFMDDSLYSLPSKAFPKLPGDYHYSFGDIAAFCAYAKQRGVTLIPEIEVPGHCRQFIERYPEVFGVTPVDEETKAAAVNIVCAGRQQTMDAIRTLLEELCEMFPDSPYIHIGGDEANIKVWNGCADCIAYMRANGISGEKALYSDFVARITRMVLDLGRTPIVWEGFPKEGVEAIPKETIVIAWESYYHLADDLLAAGFRVINAAWKPLYVVDGKTAHWGPKELLNWDVYNWQHWWPKSPAYLNPIHVQPTDQVLGAQICVWECNYEREIHHAVHNTITLSERLWTVKRLLSEEDYFDRHYAVAGRVFRLIAER